MYGQAQLICAFLVRIDGWNVVPEAISESVSEPVAKRFPLCLGKKSFPVQAWGFRFQEDLSTTSD